MITDEQVIKALDAYYGIEHVDGARESLRGIEMPTKYKWLPSEPTQEMTMAWCANCHAWDLDAYKAMWQAAPEVEQEPVPWKHDCAALLQNDVELWVDRCPYCGKPRTTNTQPPSTEQEASRTQGMTLKQRIEHVGGTFIKDDLVVFGSIMAVNALIGHVIRDIPPQPKREQLSGDELQYVLSHFPESICNFEATELIRLVEKAHGIGVTK